jgi:hypothetical protein
MLGLRVIFKTTLVFCFVLLAFYACKKEVDTVSLPKPFTTYYPLKSGNYYIYACDSVKWNSFKNQFDTFNFEMKETIDSSFIDNANNLAYIILRQTRKNDSFTFTNDRRYYTKKTASRVERIEENIRYVKLRFPLTLNKRWNGNYINNNDSLNLGLYTSIVTSLNQPQTINNLKFDSTTSINLVNYQDFLENKFAYEVYAAGVGLVETLSIDTVFQQFSSGYKNTTGKIMHQRIKSYSVK